MLVDKVEWIRHEGKCRGVLHWTRGRQAHITFLLLQLLLSCGVLMSPLLSRIYQRICTVTERIFDQRAIGALDLPAPTATRDLACTAAGQANLYAIDVDPTGKRIATCGGNQVKIWNLLPVVDPRAEAHPGTPKLLATLVDHISSVNVVRFSHSGRFIASGADDRLVNLVELKPGRGTAAFGSKEAPNVENWKLVQSFRGHTSNVSDLAWSAEDRYIATCSFDNLVIIWDPSNGSKVTTLEGRYQAAAAAAAALASSPACCSSGPTSAWLGFSHTRCSRYSSCTFRALNLHVCVTASYGDLDKRL